MKLTLSETLKTGFVATRLLINLGWFIGYKDGSLDISRGYVYNLTKLHSFFRRSLHFFTFTNSVDYDEMLHYVACHPQELVTNPENSKIGLY